MENETISRRKVVAAGVAGAAVLGTVALVARRAGLPGSSGMQTGIAVVQGGASEAAGAIAATASVSQEMLGWQAAVGKSFRISSTAGSVAGKLVSVAGAPVVGARPASIRQQPFWLKFELDSGYAAASDDIYFVESGVTTATNLFLQRGEAGLFAALLN